MRHTGTVPLQTDRLLLRPFTLNDCQAAFDCWFGDERVMDWMREKPHRDWTVTAELLALWQQQSDSNPRFYCWAIQRRALRDQLRWVSLPLARLAGALGAGCLASFLVKALDLPPFYALALSAALFFGSYGMVHLAAREPLALELLALLRRKTRLPGK